MEYKFKGVCPVVNVPFLENGAVDVDSFKKEIDFVIDGGCTSLCLFAFNSEPHKMSIAEKKATVETFLNYVNGRAETLIGIIENSITGGIELAQQAEALGADGLILYPPSLSTPAGNALIGYFEAISQSVNLDIMIQDNPRSTGVQMSQEFIFDAFKKVKGFRYLKVECPIPMRKLRKLVAATEGKLKCYSGNGGIFAIDAALSGAWGIMPGAVIAKYFVAMYKFIADGKVDAARSMFECMLPFVWYEDQSLEFYIACEKILLHRLGICATETVREPACVLSADEREELFTLYDRAVCGMDAIIAVEG